MLALRWLRGLRAQILLWTILPLAVALIALSLAGIFRHRQAMTQLVEQRDRSLAQAEATSVGHMIERRSLPLIAAAGAPALGGDPATLGSILVADTGGLGGLYPGGLALFDSQGNLLVASPNAVTWPQTDAARSLAQHASGDTTAHYASDPALNRNLLVAASGDRGRVLVGAVPFESLALAEAGTHVQTETKGAVYLMDGSGRPLLTYNPNGMHLDQAALGRAVQAVPSSTSAMLLNTGRPDLMATYARIAPPGWALVGVEDLTTMDMMSISVVELLPMGLLFITVIALLGLSFGVVNIVRPLQELESRAARVAWGDFEGLDEPVGGVEEIDRLRCALAQMAERIRSYQTGMRDYLSAVTHAQEEERSRLAHELHDDTVQALIALKQRAQMARKALVSDGERLKADGQSQATPLQPAANGLVTHPAPISGQSADIARAAARLDELERLIDEELAGLRRLIGDLRPIYLEDLGFVPAVEMMARHVGEQHGLPATVRVSGEAVRLASDLELTAFRIVQQAVRNVVDHAAASLVDIHIDFDTDGLTLVVQDDGRGFDVPEMPSDLTRAGHFGVMGMRERAMLYGGRLTIASAPGHGTTVTAWLPIC
jgi:signal transduction histidine kinase